MALLLASGCGSYFEVISADSGCPSGTSVGPFSVPYPDAATPASFQTSDANVHDYAALVACQSVGVSGVISGHSDAGYFACCVGELP